MSSNRENLVKDYSKKRWLILSLLVNVLFLYLNNLSSFNLFIFLYSFIFSFVHSCIHLFSLSFLINLSSFVHSFIFYNFIIYSVIHKFIHLFFYSSLYAFTYFLMISPLCITSKPSLPFISVFMNLCFEILYTWYFLNKYLNQLGN